MLIRKDEKNANKHNKWCWWKEIKLPCANPCHLFLMWIGMLKVFHGAYCHHANRITTRNLAFCNCLLELVSSCMRHMQLEIRPIAYDKLHEICNCMRQSYNTVGLYGFIHPYSILAVGRATACNYRGCIHTALHVN
jgi:hypothetical protein